MEEMQAQGIEWFEHYRHAAGAALKDVLEGRLAAGIDRHLEDMAAHAVPTGATAATGVAPGLNPGVGEIELGVPRTRTYSALEVVRAAHVDRLERMRSSLACFVLGLSTRKVAVALAPILGRRISPARAPVGAVGRASRGVAHQIVDGLHDGAPASRLGFSHDGESYPIFAQ